MLKFFQIHSLGIDGPNPVVLAHDAREAGEKFCQRNNLPYVVLHPETLPDTSECFAHRETIPQVWAEQNSDEYFEQIDSLEQFFVDEVCLYKIPCIECKEYLTAGMPLSMEDAKLIIQLLSQENKKEQ